MTTHSDSPNAIVIGSGFGGAIAAYHLGKAGMPTLVLERGRRWPVTAEQDTFCTYREPDGRAAWLSPESVLFEPKPIDVYTGIIERTIGDGITVWSAAAVGGGSVVYNTVLLQPTRAAFELAFGDAVDYDEMDQVYYPRVARMMGVGQIPDDVLASEHYLSTRVFLAQAEAAGLATERLNIASDWDVIRDEIRGVRKPSAIAGEIWYGINSGCKNSVDTNYLREAEASGHVEVRPLHVVKAIAEAPEGGYRVSFERIDESGRVLEVGTLGCTHLFLGAGSVGTAELLVRAKAKGALPRLNEHVGKYWANNGDTFATRAVGVRTNGGEGGPASVAIRHEDNPHGPQTLIVYPEWDAPEGTLTTLGMGVSSDFGELRHDPASDTVQIHWPSDGPGARQLLECAQYTYALLDAAVPDDDIDPGAYAEFNGHFHCPVNGSPEKSTTNSAKPTTQVNAGVTAHPLGGAVMGKACDAFGRVEGYRGLYVVDGALLPGYAGAANPALSIAAFAERCMDRIVAEDLG